MCGVLATCLLFTGAPARCVALCLRCPGPLGSCSPVCPLGALLCLCGVLGHLAPVHRRARSVCCLACAVSWAQWLLLTCVPARCAALGVRCPGPLGSCSPVCLLGVLRCVCGVLGRLAPVHRCARSACCVACAVSWATGLLFTGVPAWCVVLHVGCPGPAGSYSPVRPLGALLCFCGVLAPWLLFTAVTARCVVLRVPCPGPLDPVYQCACSVCCIGCAVSWAPWLLFSGVPARCVVLRVRCCEPVGSRSLVCLPGALLCVYGILGPLPPVHPCARSVCCVACAVSWATWLLFTGVPARCVVLCVRCPGPLGSCSPVCPLGVLCCVCRVLGHLAPVDRCAGSVCRVACTVSRALWLLFTGVPPLCAVLCVPCPGPLAPVHRCACSVCCVVGCVCGGALGGAHSSIRTAAVRSRQGLGTLRTCTPPSGRRLFRSREGLGTLRARTGPSGRRLFHSWQGLGSLPGAHTSVRMAAGVAWHLFSCRDLLRIVRTLRVCGTRRPLLLGTCPFALVVAGSVPLWRASWPRGAPRLVRSGRSRCSGRLSRRRGAFHHPWGLRPRLYWVAARGTRRPAENRAHRACRWPPPRLGCWARSGSYPFRAPRWGCPWRVPPASVLRSVRGGGWRVWTRSPTRPVSRTVRRSTGDSAGAPGLFRVDADTSPCGSQDATPGSRVCVCVLLRPGRFGRAGVQGAFWCASPFPLAPLSFCFARPPPGSGCPFFVSLVAFPPPFFFLLLPCVPFSARPPCLFCSLVPSPGRLGPWRFVFLSSFPPRLVFFSPFFFFVVRPGCLWLSLVSGPVSPEPWHCVLFIFLASRFSALVALSPLLWFPLGRGLLPGGCCPPCASRGFRCCRFVLRFFLAPLVSLAFSGFLPRLPLALALCVVCFVGLPLLGSPCALASFVFPASPLAAPWRLLPPPFCVSRFSSLPLGALFFFSFSAGRRFSPPAAPAPSLPVRAWCLVLSGVAALRCPSVFCAVLWCLALLCCGLLRAVWCLLGCLFVCHAALLAAAACCAVSLVVPSGRVVRGVACCLVLVWIALCPAVLCVPGCGAAPRCCASCLPVWCYCVLCCFVVLVWCRCLLCRVLWRCPSPWGPVLCGAVFCGVPPRCVLCAACVLLWRAGARCCSPLCCVLCVSFGVVLCVPCPLRSVRCCVPLCRCAWFVLFVWGVLLPAPGAVVRCCVLWCFLWRSVVRCWVWRPVVVCRWCVPVSVSLSGRLVCFPVVGVVCCGALLPCVVFCGAVLSRDAVLLCSAVVLRCCLCLLCPPVACRAPLCCAVGCLFCFVPGGGVCVLWCPFPPCRHAQKH